MFVLAAYTWEQSGKPIKCDFRPPYDHLTSIEGFLAAIKAVDVSSFCSFAEMLALASEIICPDSNDLLPFPVSLLHEIDLIAHHSR